MLLRLTFRRLSQDARQCLVGAEDIGPVEVDEKHAVDVLAAFLQLDAMAILEHEPEILLEGPRGKFRIGRSGNAFALTEIGGAQTALSEADPARVVALVTGETLIGGISVSEEIADADAKQEQLRRSFNRLLGRAILALVVTGGLVWALLSIQGEEPLYAAEGVGKPVPADQALSRMVSLAGDYQAINNPRLSIRMESDGTVTIRDYEEDGSLGSEDVAQARLFCDAANEFHLFLNEDLGAIRLAANDTLIYAGEEFRRKAFP